jgi:nicotinate-nucleotide adenylyltransferase
LLGGSFNPAHDGHRHVSLLALAHLGLDEVWWLVSPQNPLKPVSGMASLSSRREAACLAARHPRIRVTDVETALGTRYTADTLARVARTWRGLDFVWLMGADNLAQMARWRRWSSIFHIMPIAVFDRSRYSLSALAGLAAQRFRRWRIPERAVAGIAKRRPPAWVFFHTRLHPASATGIRAREQGSAVAAEIGRSGLKR